MRNTTVDIINNSNDENPPVNYIRLKLSNFILKVFKHNGEEHEINYDSDKKIINNLARMWLC